MRSDNDLWESLPTKRQCSPCPSGIRGEVPAYQGLSLAKSRKAGRKIILLLIVGLAIGLGGCRQVPILKDLNYKEHFGFTGIEFYLKPEQVESKLGRPQLIEDGEIDELHGDKDGKTICWHYKNIRLWFGENSVYRIRVTSGAFPTKMGICVGDSVEKLVRTYGIPAYAHRSTFQYFVGEAGACMTFIIEKGKIIAINMELGC